MGSGNKKRKVKKRKEKKGKERVVIAFFFLSGTGFIHTLTRITTFQRLTAGRLRVVSPVLAVVSPELTTLSELLHKAFL